MEMTNSKIVEPTSADQKKIISLVNEAYWREQQPYFIDTLASRERLNLTQLSKLMQESTQKIFVLKNQNKILGVITIDFPVDQDFAKFGLFAMDQKYCGKGLGQLLINHVEKYAREHGRKVMKIEVFTFATRLANYYHQLGYTFTGNTATFFHDHCIKPEYQNPNKMYLNEMIKTL